MQNKYSILDYYITFIFFHPDFTVGLGISPNHASAEWHPLAGCTAGRELHPALKNQIFGFAGQSLYCSA